MAYRDPEQQRIAKRDSARRRRALKRSALVPTTYVAGRKLITGAGTVEPGQPIDVSTWSADALRVALATGEVRVPPAPGRATYRATHRLRVGDHTVEPGEEIIEANTWRDPGPWLRMGQIEANPLAHLPL
ncbi:MAG TPA: hypothetical protein VNU19_15585 [Candidatus Acidoferrum sp.]|jgi:hypothetical protein|nr:hypothetical protein [Candidatus Acidoferrum sp.]